MNEVTAVRRNSVFSFLSSVSRLLANVFLFVGIARFYSPEVFGQFTMAHTVMTLVYLFADFGFDLMLTTEVARDRDRINVIVPQYFSMKILFSLISVVGMWAIALMAGFDPVTRFLVLVFSVGIIGNAVTNFFFALFKGCEQLQFETQVSLIQNSILLCALVVLGILRADIVYVGIAFVITRVISAGLMVYLARTRLRVSILPLSPWISWPIMKNGLGFGLHLFFGTLYFQLDTLLIAHWYGNRLVGVYQAVMKPVTLTLVIADVVMNAALPVLSRYHAGNEKQWMKAGNLLGKLLFFIGVPISLILYLYAGPIIGILYGRADYAAAVPVMQIFALILLIRFGAEAYAVMLTTSRHQISRMWVVIGVTAVNFVLNWFLIPEYGVLGAAIVSLISNILLAGVNIIVLQLISKQSPVHISPNSIAVLVIAVIVAVLFPHIRMMSGLPGIVLIAVAFPVLYYVWGFSADERRLVFSLSLRSERTA